MLPFWSKVKLYGVEPLFGVILTVVALFDADRETVEGVTEDEDTPDITETDKPAGSDWTDKDVDKGTLAEEDVGITFGEGEGRIVGFEDTNGVDDDPPPPPHPAVIHKLVKSIKETGRKCKIIPFKDQKDHNIYGIASTNFWSHTI